MSGPGRPRTFDVDETLDRAVELFWCHGREGVTTRLLEARLGVGQSSLYHAFGSKDGLFRAAADRYEARVEAELFDRLSPGGGPDSVVRFLDALVEWVGDDTRRGCLLVNWFASAPDSDEHAVIRARRHRDRLREAIRGALAPTTDDTDALDRRTELLVGHALGITLAARSRATRSELEALAAAAGHLAASWAPACD